MIKISVKKVIGIALLSASLSVVGMASVSANNSTYYDNNTALIVGETRFVQKASVRVNAYFDNPTGNHIYIDDYNYCPSNTMDLRQSGDSFNGRNLGRNTPVTRFALQRQVAGGRFVNSTTFEGRYNANIGCDKTYDHTVPNFSEADRDPATGKFVVSLRVTHINKFSGFDGVQNGFRVRVNNNGIVTHAAGTQGHEVTFERLTNDRRYHNYTLNFGSDCSVVSDQIKKISFYDLDNRQAGVQPESMRVRLREADKGTARWQYINLTYQGRTTTEWMPPGGDSGQNIDTDVYFTAKPSKRYQLELNNVYSNNTVQFGLPFDGIFYDPGCMEWKMNQESGARVIPNASTGVSSRWGDYTNRPSREVSEGQQVHFMHRATNIGEWRTMSPIGTAIQTIYPRNQTEVNNLRAGEFATLGSNPQTVWNPRGTSLASNNYAKGQARYYWAAYGGVGQSAMRVTVPSGKGGSFICQRLATPYSFGDQRWRFSKPACVRIASSNFDLTPKMAGGGTVALGASLDITATVENKGSTPSAGSQGSVVRVVVPKTSTFAGRAGYPTFASSLSPGTVPWACDISGQFFGAGNIKQPVTDGCRIIAGVGSFGRGITRIPIAPEVVPDFAEEGDQVCYITIVNRYSHTVDNRQNRVSNTACFRVVRIPFAQFWGGDVRVGMNAWSDPVSNPDIITRIMTTEGRAFGSWAEYGLMAPGTIRSSSGAGLSAGASGRDPVPTPPQYNQLTFANRNLAGLDAFGAFGSVGAPRLPNTFFAGGTTVGSIDIGSAGTGTYQLGSTTLSGGTVAQGRTLVIKSSGTVTITGNIQYDSGPVNDASQIPQLVIIAQNIVIDPSVERVDAWLMARGYMSTCKSVSGSAWLDSIDGCDRPLRLNGPLMATHLYLRRTHTAGVANYGEPAEIINLRPDAYMWGYARSKDSGAIQTTYIRELPPRF